MKKLSHNQILTSNIGVFMGLLILISIVFSFGHIDTDSKSIQFADSITKMILVISPLFFVSSIITIINYNLKDETFDKDTKHCTVLSLRLFRFGCWYLTITVILFVTVHEMLQILESS